MSAIRFGDNSSGVSGNSLHKRIAELYPICRSITGDGVRKTLQIINNYLPIDIFEVPSGTAAFDWQVPQEWNIEDAYIEDNRGRRIVDFRNHNLHVVGYSTPLDSVMTLEELKPHLHFLEKQPDWIPYRVSYYAPNWGFCLAYNTFMHLEDEKYHVCIKSELTNGSLTYGECFLPGESEDEILVSTHICHPSLCNDNLSGIVVTTALAEYLRSVKTRYSYRLIFIPGTIGSIVWLSRNEHLIGRIKNGMVITGVGDPGHCTYKRSRRQAAEIDRAAEHVLKFSGTKYEIQDFVPYGYDERQFCSPGFDLPVGCYQRTPYGRYPQYHTSADNLDFVHPESLLDSYNKCLSIFEVLENNRKYINTSPKCEPQLGKRGLYEATGGRSHRNLNQMALLWVLNLSDGQHDLLSIAERSKMEFSAILDAALALQSCGLLVEKQ